MLLVIMEERWWVWLGYWWWNGDYQRDGVDGWRGIRGRASIMTNVCLFFSCFLEVCFYAGFYRMGDYLPCLSEALVRQQIMIVLYKCSLL